MRGQSPPLLLLLLLGLAVGAQALGLDSSASSGECVAQYTCSKPGEGCQGDFHSSPALCLSKNVACCQWPLHCSPQNVCVASNLGEKCSDERECYNEYDRPAALCIGGECAEMMSANDDCANSSHCLDGMECKGGVCVGFSHNESCTPLDSHTSCEYGMACDPRTSECVSAGAEDALCGEGLPGCHPTLTCSRGHCVKLWSLEAGAMCSAPGSWAQGQPCKQSMVCSGANGTCKAGVQFSVEECKSNADCGVGSNGKCECSKFNGKSYCGMLPEDSNDCFSALLTAQTCWNNNKCFGFLSKHPSSCVQLKCLTATNVVFGCTRDCGVFRETYGSCITGKLTNNCPLIPVWGKILIAFTILISLIAILAISYAAIKNCRLPKKGYERLPK